MIFFDRQVLLHHGRMAGNIVFVEQADLFV